MVKTTLIYLAIFLFYSFSFSQREKFDCYSLNKNTLLTEYNKLKHYGLQFIVKTDMGDKKDLMPFAIDFLRPDELRQFCINAWGEVEEYGSDFCRSGYIKLRGYVSKSTYEDNIDYLEILSSIYDKLWLAGYRPYVEEVETEVDEPIHTSLNHLKIGEEAKKTYFKKRDSIFQKPINETQPVVNRNTPMQDITYVPASTYFDKSGDLIGNRNNLKWVWSFVMTLSR